MIAEAGTEPPNQPTAVLPGLAGADVLYRWTIPRLVLGGIGLTLFLLAIAGLEISRAHGANPIVLMWSASAIIVAIALRCRTLPLPALLSVGVIANVGAGLLAGGRPDLAIVYSLGHGLEALLTVLVVRRYASGTDFRSTRNLVVYFLASVGPGAVVAAALAGVAQHVLSDVPVLVAAQQAYTADVIGYFCVGPVLLTLRWRAASDMWRQPLLLRSLGSLALTVAALAAVFLQSEYPLLFLAVVPIAAAGFLAGFEGVSISILLATFACGVVLHAGVPVADFSDVPLGTQVRMLQVLLAVSAFAGFLIAAQLHDRARVASALTQLRVFMESASDYAICLLDPDGRVLSWNRGAERIWGYAEPEVIGRPFTLFDAEDGDRAAFRAGLHMAAGRGDWERTLRSQRRDGSLFWAHQLIHRITDAGGRLTGFASLTRDVTERHESQEALDRTRAALVQAQKMEAVGQLTGGMAHDFNNYLTVIRGNAEMLVEDLDPAGPDAQKARLVLDAAGRAAELTRSLLAFSRKQVLEPRRFDLNLAIRRMSVLLRRSVPESITLDYALTAGEVAVYADEAQLESALLNLVVNARDAVGQSGRITIGTAIVAGDGAGASAPMQACLTISDTGAGMTSEVLARAVEPFFTTKAGQGSGLGLSMVYGFAEQSQGALKLSSVPGEGTEVRLFLPLAAPGGTEVAGNSESGDLTSRGETLLVVEDNPAVRLSLTTQLMRLGYRTITASTGPEAFERVRDGGTIDLVVTDIVMPGEMSGAELALKLATVAPELPVLLTSGYARDLFQLSGPTTPPRHFLAKPYGREQLAAKVRETLAAGGRGDHDRSSVSGR